MALKELSPEQIREWSLEKKDEWWLKNVYRGDMPQLNARSAITGMLLGGILSLTNLYVGIKTGWTLGVGISSVILSYAIFKAFDRLKIGKEMTILENNAMQSVATSAGYMTAPLVSSIPAYMLVTGKVIPMGVTLVWIILLSILGVLYAFPLKKRFINDEQLPFPEGYAAGVVMSNLHAGEGKDGLFKAKLLGIFAAGAAVIETIRNEAVMAGMKLKFLTIPEYWDDLVYKVFTPTIMGTPLKDLTVRFETSIVMFATGGLVSMKTGFSLILGACINYLILAPYLIHEGIIPEAKFKAITMWALWGGVAMMTTSSLYSFFSKPEVILSAFKKLKPSRGGSKKKDILADIELPMKTFVIGIPVVGALCVWFGHVYFDFGIMEGLIAIPLTFVFTLIAVNSTGLTAITPGGALGKLTQLTYSIISPGNVPTNIMAAGINGEVSLNASNLLMDIKPGYLLGAKPRQQAVGHVLGIFAGGIVAVPVYYLLFNNDLSLLTSEKFPMPGAITWKAVAEALTKGLDVLHPTARWAVLVGAIIGIVLEFIDKRTHGKFPLSGVGLGLAFVLPFSNAVAMGAGAVMFWYFERTIKDKKSMGFRVFVDNRETICAGAVAGGSIIGLILMLLETMVFAH